MTQYQFNQIFWPTYYTLNALELIETENIKRDYRIR